MIFRRSGAINNCPISKKSFHESGFSYPEHTEFLTHLAKKIIGQTFKSVMMFFRSELKTVPITIHTALCYIPDILNKELIIDIVKIVEKDLRKKFAIKKPCFAISGLNPHTGENGIFENKKKLIIKPAIKISRKKELNIHGVFSLDALFHRYTRKKYDLAFCIYHDQVLIPIKTLDFGRKVNVTLDLPFVRTSPDHGTSFDITKKGIASPEFNFRKSVWGRNDYKS